MKHSVELILDVRPSPDLVDATLEELGAIVEEATTESKLQGVTKQRPSVRVAQKEPGTIVYWLLVGITFVFVTGPQAYRNIRSFVSYCAQRFQKQSIPLRKLEVKLDGKTIMKYEGPADQLLVLNAEQIGKNLQHMLKQANES